MGKRKIYKETDFSAPLAEHRLDHDGIFVIPETVPPDDTHIKFGINATCRQSFDFAPWYGVGIDSITYACQRQIERFQGGLDAKIQITTLTAYCVGLRYFLDYLVLRAIVFKRDMTLAEIDRDLIDGYISYLGDMEVSTTTCKSYYTLTKPVLLALGRRGLIILVTSGDSATFPNNPYPNSNRQLKGEVALPKGERQAFSAAVKDAIKPIWRDDVLLTSDLLTYSLLIVALHTGRNTTPLLEMNRDCLRAHPKDGSTFLVLWKRRGHNSTKVILRAESTHAPLLESTPTIKTNVERLIRRILQLTESLLVSAPDHLKGRAWLYQSRCNGQVGQVNALTANELAKSIRKLVVSYGLTDSEGQPLRINISRLRKTFSNRIFELLDGDLATTAIALGNTPQVTGLHYLMPTEEAKRNWRFMGEILVQELLSNTIGTTYHETPMGQCNEPVNGQYAPKKEGATCINFLNCVRCRNFAVTGDDLHKLFSFYYRILCERTRVGKRRWAQSYAHIPRLIENYIVTEGLKRGSFSTKMVEGARERARVEPHPFWSFDTISDLELFS